MSIQFIKAPYLEGRTTDELRALAASFELKFPSGLDRNRIIEELLEYVPCLRFYQQNELAQVPEFEKPLEQPNTQIELPDPNPLPKQYFMTFIDVLVRDPFWVFAIWEISPQDRKQHEKKSGFSGYSLRVRHESSGADADGDCVHITQIGERDTMRYLNFPPGACSISYIIELCADNRETSDVLAASRPFTLPKSLPPFGSDEEAALQTPMMILSGIEELRVLRGAL